MTVTSMKRISKTWSMIASGLRGQVSALSRATASQPRARRRWRQSCWSKTDSIERDASWPKGVALQLGQDPDLPELGADMLLDTHVEEAVHSVREPVPRGFRYADARFGTR